MTRGLQDEIKQTVPFANRSKEALLNVLRTAAMVDHQINEVLKPFGITGTQYNVLRILRGAGSGGLCGREVGERMIARVPDVPRLLDRMETLELITRERNDDDRRHVTARVSPKGLDLVAKVSPRLGSLEVALTGRLSESQLQAIIDGLTTVRESV